VLQSSESLYAVPGVQLADVIRPAAAVVSRLARIAPAELAEDKQNFKVHTSWPVPEQIQVLQPSAALYEVPGVQLEAGLAPDTAIVSRLARIAPSELADDKQNFKVHTSWPVPEQMQVLQPSAALYEVPGVQLAAGLAPATAIVSRLAKTVSPDLALLIQNLAVQASCPVPLQKQVLHPSE
jgi:hypothetical protein